MLNLNVMYLFQSLNSIFSQFTAISGEISSKTNTWPIFNTECWKGAKSAKIYFSRVYIFKSRVEKNYTIYL